MARLVLPSLLRLLSAAFCDDGPRHFWIVSSYYVAACLVFMPIEGWTLLETCYYITATITTVGYGDVAPQTEKGRVWAFFFILFGLSVVFTVIASVAQRAINMVQARAISAVEDDPTDHHEPHIFKMVMSVAMILVCILIGASFYYFNGEFDGNVIHAFWWSLATVTTVGYGDLSITKDSSRVFTIGFMVVSVLVTATAIGNISSVREDIKREKEEAATLERLDPALIKEAL